MKREQCDEKEGWVRVGRKERSRVREPAAHDRCDRCGELLSVRHGQSWRAEACACIAGREGGRKGGREEGTTNLNPNPNLTVGSGLPVVLAVHLRNREQSQFVLYGVFSK
jgi:hypothetical protein